MEVIRSAEQKCLPVTTGAKPCLAPVCCLRKPIRIGPEAGFTLLELIIAVLILGILVLLAQPLLLSSIEDARMYSAGSEVSTALRYAQNVARNTARNARVRFDTTNETVALEQWVFEKQSDFNDPSKTEINAADVEDPGKVSYQPMPDPIDKGKDYVVNFKATTRFEGVNIVSATFAPLSTVTFLSTGLPLSGGTVVLTYGARTATITVDGVTGAITEAW